MNKFFDKDNRRIALFGKEANADFWDSHWSAEDGRTIKANILSGKGSRIVRRFTAKYLARGSRILDGGCGIGQNVFALNKMGYDAYGLDYAKETIAFTKTIFPEMNLSCASVNQTPYRDNFFDGYWSLGVIEHCRDGYDSITEEAARIIKPNGYFFAAFPMISVLRAIKIRLGIYKKIKNGSGDNFYQYFFDPRDVAGRVQSRGFALVEKHSWDAIKGLKDEIKFLEAPLQAIYDNKIAGSRFLKYMANMLLGWFCGHMALLVFRKK